MIKPDATKQHQRVNIFQFRDAIAYGDGPYCWNCELSFKSFEDAAALLYAAV